MRVLVLVFAIAALASAQAEEMHIKAARVSYEAAKAARRAGQLSLATDLFHKAIEIEPTFMGAHEGLIRVYLDSGHPWEAAESITHFLEIEPEAAQYRLILGRILLELKQPERALAQFSLLLRTDPFHAEALLGFASTARRMGMEDRAQEALDRGRKHYPSDERFKSSSVKHD